MDLASQFDTVEAYEISTIFGKPSAPVQKMSVSGLDFCFLARHGNPHKIAPHQVNYRANLQALCSRGVRIVIAINAVGAISESFSPGQLIVPDQIIDYTWGRGSTFFEGELDAVTHIDFSFPYTESARAVLIEAASKLDVPISDFGVYGATQGPRLETAAEIVRLERDGCDLVGMTGMPEASLAAELKLNYVCLGLVVNWAAGKSDHIITMEEIEAAIEQGMSGVKRILVEAMGGLGALSSQPA